MSSSLTGSLGSHFGRLAVLPPFVPGPTNIPAWSTVIFYSGLSTLVFVFSGFDPKVGCPSTRRGHFSRWCLLFFCGTRVTYSNTHNTYLVVRGRVLWSIPIMRSHSKLKLSKRRFLERSSRLAAATTTGLPTHTLRLAHNRSRCKKS